MLITLSFGGIWRTSVNIAKILAIVANNPALPTEDKPNFYHLLQVAWKHIFELDTPLGRHPLA